MSNSNNAGFGQHDNCTCEIDMETVKEWLPSDQI
jgi:hypothetical protein